METKQPNELIKEILEWIPCETCSEERVFGSPPDNSPENKYVYNDLSWTTRCFCKKHMVYGKEWSCGLKDFEEDHDYPLYWAKLISEILSQ